MRLLHVIGVAVLTGATVLAHPGGLDAKGGHFNWKTGKYHVHRAPTATTGTSSLATYPAVTNTQVVTYWLTAGSGVRHNSKCRYHGMTKGRACGAAEGRPCKICGG
ncbi:MAG TPA: YHYH domain-containing protein [Kiritimatiellia bacterium]|jgi:hypothetical protein